MVTITNTSLEVGVVDGHPGLRRVSVAYDLEYGPDDNGVALVERAAVHAVDEHDAPTAPRGTPVVVFHGVVAPGLTVQHRTHEANVRRVDLDVEQDWWTNDDSGEVIPIAEWADHLIADVSLHPLGDAVATAASQVLTGSWGPLGTD